MALEIIYTIYHLATFPFPRITLELALDVNEKLENGFKEASSSSQLAKDQTAEELDKVTHHLHAARQ